MDLSVMQLIRKTFPFIITQIVIYALFGFAALLFLAGLIGIGYLLVNMFGDSSAAIIIVIVASFLIVFGGLKFLERYVLYLVKTGHIAVITKLLQNGKVPEGKGLVAYGKEQVTKNFGAANVAFVLDKMVHAAVRQIQRWIITIGNIFSFVPGSKNIVGIINTIMSVALNYIDEAIMSYIFLKKSEKSSEEQSPWKLAADGVVLYAESWKGVIKAAVIAVLFVYAFNIIMFLIFVFPLIFIANLMGGEIDELGLFLGFIAVAAAFVITTALKRALVDPIITIIMIRAYQMSIRGKEPAIDLQEKLLGISPRFKRLVQKAEEEERNNKVVRASS